jgi:hypothetical protein
MVVTMPPEPRLRADDGVELVPPCELIVAGFYVADVTVFDGAKVRRRHGVLVREDRIAWAVHHARRPGRPRPRVRSTAPADHA